MSTQNIVESIAACFSTGDVSIVDSLFDATYVDHQRPDFITVDGPEEFKQIVALARKGMPELVVTSRFFVENDGVIMTRLAWVFKQDGEKMVRETIETLRLVKGKVVEHWGGVVKETATVGALKDFEQWGALKQTIQTTRNIPFCKEGEVWYANIGTNIGFEQDGAGEKYVRPILIIKQFTKNLFIGCPLTRTHKTTKFYAQVELKNRTSTVILSQVRLYDALRLENKLGEVSQKDVAHVREKLITLLQ